MQDQNIDTTVYSILFREPVNYHNLDFLPNQLILCTIESRRLYPKAIKHLNLLIILLLQYKKWNLSLLLYYIDHFYLSLFVCFLRYDIFNQTNKRNNCISAFFKKKSKNSPQRTHSTITSICSLQQTIRYSSSHFPVLFAKKPSFSFVTIRN